MTQSNTFVGQLNGQNCRIAIVVSRFNDAVGERLLRGAQDALVRHAVAAGAIDVVWVPGAFEIPLAAKKLAEARRYDAVIALGAVIRGATPHFDLVASQVAAGVSRVALDTGIPVIFGVLTTDTVEQAADRSGLKAGNKGADAATAALEMIQLLKVLPRKEQ